MELRGCLRMSWWQFPCRKTQLWLDVTLSCGQSFRWRQDAGSGEWRSCLPGSLCVWRLKQTVDAVLYKLESPSEKESILLEESARQTLFDYFNFDVDLESLYTEWQRADRNFAEQSARLKGVRMLRQDPTETLFSFICSSNNNIERISGMVEKLCVTYGEYILEFDGRQYYTFPVPHVLAAEGVEDKLRKLGFGYRAKYIHQTAKVLASKPDGWLDELRKAPYREAHAELLTLPGVGAKVADCICLMSLDKMDAIPVDTHMWQIAARDYKLKVTNKSLTTKVYNEIGDHFRKLFGQYAGWAHSVLFSADFKKFQSIQVERNKIESNVHVEDSPVHQEEVEANLVTSKSAAAKRKRII